jgi:hypothetical protein
MAQTKSQRSTRRTSNSQRSRSGSTRSGSRSGSTRSRSRSASTRSRSRSGSTRARSQARRNGTSPAQRVRRTARKAEHSVSDAASGAGRTVGNIASKAKGPAIATGAAAAGLAGGILIASRKQQPKLFGVIPRPKADGAAASIGKGLLRATENVGKASENVGELTEEVRRVREGIEADGKRRSPIEVVLDGLTHRPS